MFSRSVRLTLIHLLAFLQVLRPREEVLFLLVWSHTFLSLPSLTLPLGARRHGSDERPEFCTHTHTRICFQPSVSFWFKPMKVFRCLAGTARNICYQLFTFFRMIHFFLSFNHRFLPVFFLLNYPAWCRLEHTSSFSPPVSRLLPLPLSITVRL